jgi:hypothetical protein
MLGNRTGSTDDDNGTNKIKNKFRRIRDSCDNADDAALQQQNGSLPHPQENEGNKMVDLRNIDPRAVDAMLARELQQLSFQDREAVTEVRSYARNALPPYLLDRPTFNVTSFLNVVGLDFVFRSFLPGDSWSPHACSHGVARKGASELGENAVGN